MKERLRHLKRSVLGPRVKRVRERLDDNEVRQARRLVRALRSDHPPDVVAFGDSNWVFRAGYDVDQRNLPTMIADELGPDVSMRTLANAGYYSTVVRSFVRLIELSGEKPVIIVPLCARLLSVAWSIHPRYTYARAIEKMATFDEDTPLWRMRAAFPATTPEEFAAYGSTEITTFAGTQTIDALRAPLLDPAGHGLDETERRRLLYAYHHGERMEGGEHPLLEIEELGRALRRLGSEVVVFETTLPVDEGVALWGEQFRENGANSFRLLREAFRRGYGDPIDIIESGMIMDRSEFIDPADGSEHLNERGRRRQAALIVEATRAALDRRSE